MEDARVVTLGNYRSMNFMFDPPPGAALGVPAIRRVRRHATPYDRHHEFMIGFTNKIRAGEAIRRRCYRLTEGVHTKGHPHKLTKQIIPP